MRGHRTWWLGWSSGRQRQLKRSALQQPLVQQMPTRLRRPRRLGTSTWQQRSNRRLRRLRPELQQQSRLWQKQLKVSRGRSHCLSKQFWHVVHHVNAC